MVHDHKLAISHRTSRHLIMFIVVMMLILAGVVFCQTALTMDARADADEQEVTFMDVGEYLTDTDGAASAHETSEPAISKEDPDEAEPADEMSDEGSETDADIDKENVAENAFFILSEDPVDPELLLDEAAEAHENSGSESADQNRALENVKLRSGGVSSDPMEVLLGVVARHQQQGSTIRVISSDPKTGRVIYATD